MSELQLREQLCEIGYMLWQRGLIGATEGNISVRLSDQHLLVTPSGICKGQMDPDRLLVIDCKGNLQKSGKPGDRVSSEIKLHLRIYDHRTDCMAIVHAHPPIATGLATAGQNIPDNLLLESAFVLGPVGLTPFAMPGTDDLPNAIEPLLPHHKTFLLSHHGAVTLGKDLNDAYYRMETLERIAKVLLVSKMAGGAVPLPDAEADKFQQLLSGLL